MLYSGAGIVEGVLANPGGKLGRVLSALGALNFNAVRILLREGAGAAASYVTYSHRLYAGYGLPWIWSDLAWRRDMKIPRVPVDQVFPEIDFSRSPEVLYPFPRNLSTFPHELMILGQVVRFLQPRRVVEFGTAEGRTALNLALHLPPGGEVVTLDFAPIPEKAEIGYFYWNSPLKEKIKQFYGDLGKWNSQEYWNSAEVVLCDACDQIDGLLAETAQAFRVVKPGGVIFRHDYSSAEGPTFFWNQLSRHLPVKHLEGTTLLCLRTDDPDVYKKLKDMEPDLKPYLA